MSASLTRKLARKSKLTPGPRAAWKAIAVANRIFGPAGWSRETVELKNPANLNRDGAFSSAYVAKVRITVSMEGGSCTREGHGCGEGRGSTAFEAHDRGLKAAELDATFRVLASLGPALGLDGFLEPSAADLSPPDAEEATFPGDRPVPLAKPDEVSGLGEEEPAAKAGELMIPKLRRLRSPQHLAHVRSQPCLICGRSPADAHHVRYIQPRAMAKKVSDEFTVPLCRRHHDLLHRDPDERGWWEAYGIDPLAVAAQLWAESQGVELVS